ncbi:hypothetical protein L7F22_007453 [Adiantum nelumboides]|nr:hypothetical protein [Adiantum nelumboides]
MVLTPATQSDLSNRDVISTSQDSQAPPDVQFEEVFLFMFHKEAEVSIPRTPSHDIFMMQRLGLADSTSIVARLKPELRDWALKHMKNKNQAQNQSKRVRIPVAFIVQLVWKDEFMKAYHSKTKDTPHLESLEYADLPDVYDERREKALNEVEKTFIRRVYDYVAIANLENGVAWFNLCVQYTKWHEKANRFTINKITELARTLLPPTEKTRITTLLQQGDEVLKEATMPHMDRTFREWLTPHVYWFHLAEEVKNQKGRRKYWIWRCLGLHLKKAREEGNNLNPNNIKSPHQRSVKLKNTDMEEDLDENLEEDFEEALEEIRNTQLVQKEAPQKQAISKSHIEPLNSGSTHPLDQEILSAFTLGRNIQPVHLPLLCDTGDIAEKLYDLNNKDRNLSQDQLLFGGLSRFGDMDPIRALHGAQLIWIDFCTSPLVPTWNEMRLDLIEAAATLAKEYLLDNGTFVATLRGEDLSDVVNICGDAGFALKRVLNLDICGEFWRFDDDSDPELVIAIFNFVQKSRGGQPRYDRHAGEMIDDSGRYHPDSTHILEVVYERDHLVMAHRNDGRPIRGPAQRKPSFAR